MRLSTNIIRECKLNRMRRTVHAASMADIVGKPERKRLLSRLRHRQRYNIKMGIKAIGCEIAD